MTMNQGAALQGNGNSTGSNTCDHSHLELDGMNEDIRWATMPAFSA